MHVAIGGQNFLLLPVLILFGAFFGGVLYGSIISTEEVGPAQMVLLVQMGILMTGLILGGFAFMAPEIAEKRFGEIRLLVASQPYLPLEIRRIYFMIYMKDVIFYSSIILLPLAAGLFAAVPLSVFTMTGIAFLTLSLFLTFTLGFSLAFAISMAIIRSRVLGLTVICSIGVYIALILASGESIRYIVPSVGLNLLRYEGFAMDWFIMLLAMSAAAILLFSMMAIAFSREKWEAREHTARNVLPGRERTFAFAGDDSILIAKEYIDMIRSGGVGKIGFTFIMPVGALFMVKLLSDTLEGGLEFGPQFYAMTMGFFGMLIYYMISGSDYLASFQVLPITPAEVVHAKLKLHAILSVLVSLVMAVAMAMLFGDATTLVIALPIVLMGSLFMGVVMAFLTGFRTAEMLLEPKFLGLFVGLGAFPLSLAAALTGVLGREMHQDLVKGLLIAIVIYIIVGSYAFYTKIDDRWSDTTFT